MKNGINYSESWISLAVAAGAVAAVIFLSPSPWVTIAIFGAIILDTARLRKKR